MKYNNLDYLSDYLLVQSFSSLQKNASEGFFDNFKNEIINSAPKDMDSLIKFLQPAIIYQIITKLTGARWVGVAIGLLVSAFKIDLSSIFQKICSGIKDLVSSGFKPTQEQIADLIDSHMPEMTKTSMVINKFAFINFTKDQTTALESLFGNLSKSLNSYGIFSKLVSILWAFLRFFFITSLSAGGFMVGSAAIKALMPGSNSGDSSKTEQLSMPKSPGNKSTDYSGKSELEEVHDKGWIINRTNNKTNIENFVMDAVQKYYKISDNDLMKSNMFNSIVEHIENHNSSTKGWRVFSIPKNYKSEKDIADRIKKDLQ